jgi:hypothetical protein
MKRHLNLLPLAIQKQQMFRALCGTWLRICLVCMALSGAHYGYISHLHRQSDQRLQAMENEVQPLMAMDTSNQKLTAENALIQKRLQEFQRLEQATTPMSLLGLIGKCFAASERPIRLDSLRIDVANAVAAATVAKNALVAPRISIMMMGTAAEDAPISAVMMRLRATGVFESVDLEGSQATSQEEQQRRSFQIRCQL